MTDKDDLAAEAAEMGIELTGKESGPEMRAMIAEAKRAEAEAENGRLTYELDAMRRAMEDLARNSLLPPSDAEGRMLRPRRGRARKLERAAKEFGEACDAYAKAIAPFAWMEQQNEKGDFERAGPWVGAAVAQRAAEIVNRETADLVANVE